MPLANGRQVSHLGGEPVREQAREWGFCYGSVGIFKQGALEYSLRRLEKCPAPTDGAETGSDGPYFEPIPKRESALAEYSSQRFELGPQLPHEVVESSCAGRWGRTFLKLARAEDLAESFSARVV